MATVLASTIADLLRPEREAEARRHAAIKTELAGLPIERLWLRLDTAQRTIDELYRKDRDWSDAENAECDAAQDVLDFAKAELRSRLSEFLGDVPLDDALEAAR